MAQDEPLSWDVIQTTLRQLCGEIDGAVTLIEEASCDDVDLEPDDEPAAGILDGIHPQFKKLVNAFRAYRKIRGLKKGAPSVDQLPQLLREIAERRCPNATTVRDVFAVLSFDELFDPVTPVDDLLSALSSLHVQPTANEVTENGE